MSAAGEPRRELAFVVPPLDGPVTGGTLYNRELLSALAAHATVRVLGPDGVSGSGEGSPFVWLDSLFLARAPELKARSGRPVALFLHYLPTFVRLGRAALPGELSPEEQAALRCADALWVPSAFMRDAIEASGVPTQKIHVLEPGSHARLASKRERVQGRPRVSCVGNLTAGKGCLELLRELALQLAASDDFELAIVGSTTVDPVYADACRDVARALKVCVRFLGELTPAATLAELARADLFVSASRMESYGMALAEARVSGVPILALDAGNARAHVSAEAGGQLAENPADLARLLLELTRASTTLAERAARARAHAPSPRSWASVALEFLAQLEKCEK